MLTCATFHVSYYTAPPPDSNWCVRGHICAMYFYSCWDQMFSWALQSEDISMLIYFLKELLKVRRCWVCYLGQLQRLLGKRFGGGHVSTHGMVTMALGCSDRSQLSLQHLLSAGIYYQLQKPTQSDWILATSCPVFSLPPFLLPPCFH